MSKTLKKYDFVILGAGCAGLSLLYRMAKNPFFATYKIGIVDSSFKETNDRTWCFWEKSPGVFEDIVYAKWDSLIFQSPSSKIDLDIGDYQYKMIKGIDFYSYCKDAIDEAPNIDFIHDSILEVNEASVVTIVGEKGTYLSSQIFKSYIDTSVEYSNSTSVAQHFGGWFIRSDKDVFDPKKATFMDFRIPQEEETRFFYVLPFSKNQALVEIALFSNTIWSKEDYNNSIQKYINKYLGISNYIIEEKEYGIIPMTNYPFWQHDSNLIKMIGTAGGAVKPSSGYAFSRIQDHSDRIIKELQTLRKVRSSKNSFCSRFYYYDSTLLQVLMKQKKSTSEIFSTLFQKNRASDVFAFLKEESSIKDEVKLFATLPIMPFTRGLIQFVISKKK